MCIYINRSLQHPGDLGTQLSFAAMLLHLRWSPSLGRLYLKIFFKLQFVRRVYRISFYVHISKKYCWKNFTRKMWCFEHKNLIAFRSCEVL